VTFIVSFLLGNSPASEFYVPTFRNTLFHLHRQVGMKNGLFILHTYLPMKMEHTVCSETSAYKIQTPGNCPEERVQHLEHGESFKSVKFNLYGFRFCVIVFLKLITRTHSFEPHVKREVSVHVIGYC